MFDIIGKRRWFYLISLIITIPGLFFILLTPFTDAGLQFTIDYTGGTTWEIRFQDPKVTPDQVEAVFKSQGLEATAVETSTGFINIKTVQIADLPEPSPAPGPSGSPGCQRVARSQRFARRQRIGGRHRERIGDGQPESDAQPHRQPVTVAVRLAVPVGIARAHQPAHPRRRPRRPATRRSRRPAPSARSGLPSRPSSGRSPSRTA